MKKHNVLTCLILVLIFWAGTSSHAQELTSTQQDSIAQLQGETYFYKADNDNGTLSNSEKVALYQKADSIFVALKNWQFSFVAISRICNIYQQERAYKEIDLLSKRAIDMIRSELGEEHYYYGIALNLRGTTLWDYKSDYTGAIQLLKESIIFNKKNDFSLLYTSTTYLNLGACYQEIGAYDEAIDQLQKALKIQKDSSNYTNEIIPNIYKELGRCFHKKNKDQLAIQHFKEGIKYAKAVQPRQRTVDQVILYLYQNLAELYLKIDNLDLAQKYVQLALDFQKKQAFINDAYSYQLQGEIYLKENKNKIALIAFQKSTDLARLEFKDFDRHPQIGNAHFHTGNAWLAQHQLDTALHYYQTALAHNSSFETIINPLEAIDIFEGKAKAFLKKFEQKEEQSFLENALENYSLAIEAIGDTRQSFNADGSKFTLSEKVIPIYEAAINSAFELYRITTDQSWLEKGLQFAEGNKSAALLEAIQNHEAMGTTGIPDSLLQQEYELKVDIAFHEKLIYEETQKRSEGSIQKVDALKNTLLEFKENYQKLIDQFELNYPKYFDLKFKMDKIDLPKIQAQLQQTAMIEFFVGTKNIFVFTITASSIACERIAKSPDFEKEINQLRTLISTAPTSKTVVESLKDFSLSAHFLYQKLLSTSLQNKASQIDHLIIIPDDLLAYIPFSVLIENQEKVAYRDLPYLFKKFGLSYNYSAALWLRQLNQQRQPAKEKFLGFAPEFSQLPASSQLGPLSCNTREVRQIGAALPTEGLRLEAAASVAYFKQHAKDYQVIHLATHTMLDGANSNFNRIYFSDDYLSQNDLYQLELNADLAVLSACNTGTGALKKGEGVMSLSRGFIHSGCPSLLMSLWSVDDCTTADIMLNYYEALDQGMTKDLALQEAKKKHFEQTDNILQLHPYYWAAFVQHGDIRPISIYPSSWKWYLITGLLLIGVLVIFLFRKK